MADVYLAEDTHLRRKVAVKVLRPRNNEEFTHFQNRFAREAQVLAKLDHIHILPIYDYGEQDNLAYLVTPYLPGESLEEKLLPPGHILSNSEVLNYANSILTALDYAHSKGLVHRDIKPSNILFKENSFLQISDFGIVRILTNGPDPEHTQTSPDRVMGTPKYMAPERYQGLATPASDVYSVGVILYEMLTGGKYPNQSPSLREINPRVSPQLERVILRALEIDLTKRYQSALELLKDLTRAIELDSAAMSAGDTSIPSLAKIDNTATLRGGTPTSSIQKRRRRRRIAVTCFFILLLILGGGIIPLPPDGETLFATILPPSTTIEIASDLPLGGLDKSQAVSTENGIRFAIDKANNAQMLPGYTLKYVPYNDVGANFIHDPSVGKKNVDAAIADALVAGIIGPLDSGVAEAEMPAANRAPLAILSPANTNPCLTKSISEAPECSGDNNLLPTVRPTGKTTYFRFTAPDDLQGKAAADFLIKHYKSVYIIEDQSDLYSQGLADAFSHEWTRLRGTQPAPPLNEPSTASLAYYENLFASVDLKSDLIYFAGSSPAAINIREAMLQNEHYRSMPFAVGDTAVVSNLDTVVHDFILNDNISGAGPVYGTVPLQDTNQVPNGQSFQSDYALAGYQNYSPDSASAYDCTMILIQAIKMALNHGAQLPKGSWDTHAAKMFRQAVIDAIQGITYEGVTGQYTFNADGDAVHPYVSIYQLTDENGSPFWKVLKQ